MPPARKRPDDPMQGKAHWQALNCVPPHTASLASRPRRQRKETLYCCMRDIHTRLLTELSTHADTLAELQVLATVSVIHMIHYHVRQLKAILKSAE